METIARIIDTPAQIDEGCAWLARRDPRLAAALDTVGTVPLRRRPDGFAALAGAVVGQQVSTASARATEERLRVAGLMERAALSRAGDEALRACGLSRPKMRTLRALAASDLDFEGLKRLPDEAVIAALVALPGIGRWTAEVYAMLSLGRADVFAPGDLALREAARLIFDLPARPSEGALRGMAGDWSPWRGVAARLMWAYYGRAKDREGIA